MSGMDDSGSTTSAPKALASLGAHGLSRRIACEGYAVVPALLPEAIVKHLYGALAGPSGVAARTRRGSTYALRNLLDVPEVRGLANSAEVRSLVTAMLGPEAFPVRGILFDKTPEANWTAGWHQDLVIPVRRRPADPSETPGFTGWSIKAGVHHCHPPAEVLEGMLTVRLHLDDTGPENAPLRVLPGSHRNGKLPPEEVRRLVREGGPVACTVPAGSALMMRPLLLHASSPAHSPGHRRVIHLEFAARALPYGLHWP
jgi:hypothetical protein